MRLPPFCSHRSFLFHAVPGARAKTDRLLFRDGEKYYEKVEVPLPTRVSRFW